jgi:cobalamin biosynthesis protein CbiG
MSPDQRSAIEHLLGRTLREEESLTIRPARILQEAPVGADRVSDVSEEEIDGALEEALRGEKTS